jgi:hypothetical protein
MLREEYARTRVKFLVPPKHGAPPLIQEVFGKRKHNVSYADYRFVKFETPFDEYFGYGGELQNSSHPVAQALLYCEATLETFQDSRSFPPDVLGRFSDALSEAQRYVSGYRRFSWDEINDNLRTLWRMGREMGVATVSKGPSRSLNS